MLATWRTCPGSVNFCANKFGNFIRAQTTSLEIAEWYAILVVIQMNQTQASNLNLS